MVALSVLVVLIPGLRLFPLMWLSQVANAVLLPIILVLMLKLANDRAIMNRWANRRLTNAITTVLAILVSLATVALFV